MSHSRGLLPILCLVLAYSCAQAWNFAYQPESTVKDSEFRYIATISENCLGLIGGGSLISNYVVLTGWKFIKNRNASELQVFINEWDDSIDEKKLSVRSVVRHPNFSEKSLAYNVALLFLKKPVKFSPKIAPIKLATETSMRNLDLTSCIAKTRQLQTLPLPVLSTAICHPELRRWLGSSFVLDDSLICVGGGIGKNICDEDGYPLLCPLARDPSKFEQVGIVNWNIHCGEHATPEVYTNVARVNEWINRQISLNPHVDGPADETETEIECKSYFDDYLD